MKSFKILYIFLLTMIFLVNVSLGAFEFGFLTYQNAGYGNRDGADSKFDYQADFVPRLSFLIGEQSDFFVSAGFSLGIDGEFYYLPELLRTELTLRSGGWGIRAGRMLYADSLTFVASGLFDGVQFFYNTKSGTFNAGIWYTGLLYKKSANIIMTAEDQALYDSPLDYGDFSGTYFAPGRLLAALDWEHPSFAETLRLKASLLSQSDLTDNSEKYHSQYLLIKAGVPVKSFLFEVGGGLELAQVSQEDDDKFNMAFAWDLSVSWRLPTDFNSRLSLAGHFAGGKAGGSVDAFVPVTTKYYSHVFRPKLSGLSIIDLEYSARVNEEIGAKLNALYFVRNDLGTFLNYPVPQGGESSANGYFLGAEIYAAVVWSPVSDIQFNIGAGAFFPSLGDVSTDETKWRIEIGLIFALY